MKKYFAYDALEREFTTYDTLQEAKSQGQDCVDEIFDIGADNGFGDEIEDGIKETCFGVVLGGFDLPTRPLTEEEKEVYADEFAFMVENPVLVEYPQNEWIKCSEQLPELYHTVFSGIISKDVLLYGIPYNDGEEEMRVFVGYMREDNEFYTEDSGKCDVVTHWQPLPAPPKDE
ncbi:DUF551 domain-containing protein [Haemophilus parainfluenzae]|mgnify:CR=1 FL=1|jgi:two-component system response regulator QseB|uniref:DUF551 domain-containing protein n=1 Tax=Haemophilus parainfluenzae TaxID=729 RepID=UPI000DADF590|nr:DUF551 domain-containing protein [Haemophilus parainfluenzae]RDE78340.1 DUF551 domain-containing protein [Haemophilus parainfluenzae]